MIGAMSNMINNAIEIIKNCEDVQDSNESRYTKEEADKKLAKIRAEIDRQEKWLMDAGYTAYNVDIAFSAIKSVVAEGSEG